MSEQSEVSHFKKVRTLGKGGFGSVDLCLLMVRKSYGKQGAKVAVKRLLSVSDEEMAEREARILNKLKYQFIVAEYEQFKDPEGLLVIVMEYCEGGTLKDYLSSYPDKPFPEFCIWRSIWQLSSALAFLHGQHPPIIHNDFKPSNILLKSDPQDGTVKIKLADFGFCNILGKTIRRPGGFTFLFLCEGKSSSAKYYHACPDGGTVIYQAPEVLRDDRHITPSADMWGLGAVIAYIANDREHLFHCKEDVFNWTDVKSPLKRKFKYDKIHQLVLALLSIDKNTRPSAQQVVKETTDHLERQQEP